MASRPMPTRRATHTTPQPASFPTGADPPAHRRRQQRVVRGRSPQPTGPAAIVERGASERTPAHPTRSLPWSEALSRRAATSSARRRPAGRAGVRAAPGAPAARRSAPPESVRLDAAAERDPLATSARPRAARPPVGERCGSRRSRTPARRPTSRSREGAARPPVVGAIAPHTRRSTGLRPRRPPSDDES